MFISARALRVSWSPTILPLSPSRPFGPDICNRLSPQTHPAFLSHFVQGWITAWCLHFNYPTFHSAPLLVFASFSRRRKERASAPTRLLRLVSELLKGEGVCARAWVHVEDTNQLVIQPSKPNNYSGVKLALNLNQLLQSIPS